MKDCIYMEYKFINRHTNSKLKVKIKDDAKLQVTQFKYLESIIENDGKIMRCKS